MNWLRQIVSRKTVFRRLPRLLRKGRVPIILLWAAMVFAISQTSWFMNQRVVQEIEQALIDWRFQLRGNLPAQPDVVIVGINDSSLEQEALAGLAAESEGVALMAAQRFPWNRKVWALLIERLMQSGAKVVALYLILDGDNPGNEELAPVIAKYRDRLVLGARVSYVNTKGGGSYQVAYTVPATTLIGEEESATLAGACLFHPEIDGAIRRFDLRSSLGREAALLGLEEMDDDANDIVSFAPLAVSKFTGQPVARGYRLPIPYQGPGKTYRYLPVEEVLTDRIFQTDPRFANGSVFKDKLVFVGPIAEIMHDIHKTPFHEMPGVEIHAQLAGSLLSGRVLRDAPPATGFWLSLGVALAAVAVLIFRKQALSQSALLGLLTAGFAAAASWYFVNAAMLLPLASPLFKLAGIGVFGVLFTVMIEQIEKARIRGVLNQYVSKNVADVVLKHAEDFEQMMRGERRNVTIVFSDVRGFTSIFESADASALVEQLNEYFERMVGCIQQVDGTVQKFIGDAIMAAWGDTHSLGYGEDAVRAVRSALAMRVALRELNAKWDGNPARVQMKTGIGVNHGEVVVGEVGSQGVRKEFTLLGDAVNSAARFESATKQYHVDLLVGGDVEALTRGKFVYRAVDRARFKGKTHPIEVFTVIGDGGMAAPDWLARWHEAVELFRTARFAEARAVFQEVAAQIGGEDFLCEMYLARIAEFAQTPPAADWDGAQTLAEK